MALEQLSARPSSYSEPSLRANDAHNAYNATLDAAQAQAQMQPHVPSIALDEKRALHTGVTNSRRRTYGLLDLLSGVAT